MVQDEQEGLGPLAGMAVGLAALEPLTEAAYVSSCDVPLLRADFIRAVIDRLGDYELAIPREDDYYHPLAAVYRTSLSRRCVDLINAGKRRPLQLVQTSRSCVFNVDELRDVDDNLDSLRNANTLEEYNNLLALAGFEISESDKTR